MALNTNENRQKLIKVFPKLGTDAHFYIKSPETPEYNCIAWAMGFDDRWVDHLPDYNISKKKWWPDGVARDFKPSTLIKAFEKLGFVVCDNDYDEEGFEKVALYKTSPLLDPYRGTVIADEGWTHAARVLSTDLYHSKIGSSFDIYHRSGDVFNGTSYGIIYQFMKRRLENFIITERIKKEKPIINIPDNISDIIAKIMK